ncbi:ABC-three component system protein [Hymenobacter psoromatis]|uniref:ABC-three component system protein n=1 Tax=Hymenobacter psoromatis TaxID=1484116 RepID=UPI001CBB0D82
MIHRITSDLPSFKPVELRPGLNVIVSAKSEQSNDGQTRNKSGKSSLLMLIHFLFGKECGTESLFRKPELAAYTFSLEFDLRGAQVRVSRSGATFGWLAVELVAGSTAQWPDDPLRGQASAKIAQAKWRGVLGLAMFGLAENLGTYGPTFSQLFSYFVRRSENGGLAEPTKQAALQQPADVRVGLSYLLGLDWRISQERERLRQEITGAQKLQKVARDGGLSSVIGDPGQVFTQLTLAQKGVDRLTKALAEFRILPDYMEREKEANHLTRRFNELSDEVAQQQFYVSDLRQSLQSEDAPATTDLERLYEEAGLVLPSLVRVRYEEVRLFHESIVRNRRLYLEGEIAEVEVGIAERRRQLSKLDTRRSEVMQLLQTHGALEHHTQLQIALSKAVAQTERLKQNQQLLEEVAQRVAELKIQQGQLTLRLQRDFRENQPVLTEAVLAFEAASEALYSDPGNLSIYPSENGPEFSITIQGRSSRGVNSMQIFCFDMMLMQVAGKQGITPGFLIHDSHLFDPVDERQNEKAWAYGAELARELGFQYIIALNSDQFPAPQNRVTQLAIEQHIIPPHLTDADGGGLFGFDFY